jgi:hypothetical protein
VGCFAGDIPVVSPDLDDRGREPNPFQTKLSFSKLPFFSTFHSLSTNPFVQLSFETKHIFLLIFFFVFHLR